MVFWSVETQVQRSITERPQAGLVSERLSETERMVNRISGIEAVRLKCRYVLAEMQGKERTGELISVSHFHLFLWLRLALQCNQMGCRYFGDPTS
jgi:hypothetical protein